MNAADEREFNLRLQLGARALGILIVLRHHNALPSWIRDMVDDVVDQLPAADKALTTKESH